MVDVLPRGVWAVAGTGGMWPYPCRCGEGGRWERCGRRPMDFLEFWRGTSGEGCPCFGRRDVMRPEVWATLPAACCGRWPTSLRIAGLTAI